MSSAPDAPPAVVSLAARRGYQPDWKGLACAQVRASRERLGLSHDEFAAHLSRLLGRSIPAQLAKRWEQGNVPPGDVLLAAGGMTPAAPSLLEAVPPGFPAAALAGSWVTTYQFAHGGRPHYHADVARITAEPDGRIRAANHPPEPRSQGRRRAFRNTIEGRLIGRHLVGEWQNTSDTRYCGALQLAVLPGETVMQGHYTGVGSDIEVSQGIWKWVRLEPAADVAGIALRDPAEIHDLVMSHSQPDVPLLLAEIREEF